MLVGTSYADALFTLPREDETPPPDRPRLGVVLVDGDGAPRINRWSAIAWPKLPA